jgi:hypothetical protein
LSEWLWRWQVRVLGIEREAALLTDAADVKAARAAMRERMAADGSWVLAVGLAVLIVGIFAGVREVVWSQLPFKKWVPGLAFFVFWKMPAYVLAALAAGYFPRRHYQRGIRAYLARRGVPICVNCGYDLTGAAESRCSECGVGTGGGGANS